MTERRRTYCGLCHLRCGLILEIDNGRAVKVSGDSKHPISRGRICSRGKLILDHVYHPDRLNYPLKRKGDRGSGQWERITWDQAIDEVADKLSCLRDKYGAETLAFTHGTKRTYHWDERRFFNLFGSPNICGVNNVCMCPSKAVDYATYGGFSFGDAMHTKCLVLWGHAPSQSDTINLYPNVLAAKKRGAKLIVVDPRRIPEAEKADMFLQIRPGTDVALMLGWLNLIIKEQLYDSAFVKKWTVGFEDLKLAAMEYTPKRVSNITWLNEDQVVASARLYAETKPAMIAWGVGIDKQGVNATQAARARAILRSVTGNLDIEGGEPLGWAEPLGKIIDDAELEFNKALPSKQRAKQLGIDKYPFFGFPGWEKNLAANRRLPREYMHPSVADQTNVAHARAVWNAMINGDPYPVTAAISLASNPLLSMANSQYVYKALKKLDLYIVAEYYMTPSSALADYVFPICSTIETSELWSAETFCVACPKGIEPLYDRRNSYDFWRGLAVRFGQEDYWPWETVEKVWDYCLAPVGMTFSQLEKNNGLFANRDYKRFEQFGFGTPSGKVEIRSSIFEDLDCEPLPVYREVPNGFSRTYALKNEFPLILITGSRFMPMYHSEQRQISKARRQNPDPLVSIHPKTAANLKIVDGEWVLVVAPLGSIRVKANLTDIVHPSMVDVQHGWWFPEREEMEPRLFDVFQSNANVLCPDEPEFCSPEVGAWPHTALFCRVEKL